MPEIRTFFRHCPACGRRFEVRLEKRELLADDRVTSTLPVMEPAPSTGGEPGMAYMPITVGEGDPITVDTEEFQYTYRCRHCGHEWSEKHDKERREG